MKKYYVGQPDIYDKTLFLRRVQKVLESHIHSNNGPFVLALENKIKGLTGSSNAIAVCSATAGLEASLRLFNPGEVIVPSFTFVGTINAIKNSGNTPVYCDVDDNFCMIRPEVVSHKTTAFMSVDLFGNLAQPILSKKFCPIIHDSAHAFLCRNFVPRDIQVFSFHATKIFGGTEGGCIVTNNDEYAERLRAIRSFGNIPCSNIHGEVKEEGGNYKLDEISAAAILTQLDHKENILTHYTSNFVYYAANLPDWTKLKMPNCISSNYSYIVCEVDENIRDSFLEYLHKNNVFARKYFVPIHTTLPHKQVINLPNTERLAKRVLQLPTGLCIGSEDIVRICEIVKSYSL